MGPRLGSRGKRHGPGPSRDGTSRFNGAATWKSRKVQTRSRLLSQSNGFNGAATWKSRKESEQKMNSVDLTASMGPRLGSRGKAVEGVHLGAEKQASMGPRLGSRGKSRFEYAQAFGPNVLQWGRDLEVAERRGTRKPLGQGLGSFNGAATWKSRKVYHLPGHEAEQTPLQWGRDLEVAER